MEKKRENQKECSEIPLRVRTRRDGVVEMFDVFQGVGSPSIEPKEGKTWCDTEPKLGLLWGKKSQGLKEGTMTA